MPDTGELLKGLLDLVQDPMQDALWSTLLTCFAVLHDMGWPSLLVFCRGCCASGGPCSAESSGMVLSCRRPPQR